MARAGVAGISGRDAQAEQQVCETRTVLAIEIDAWLQGAKPGERFVYCSGPVLVRGPAAERARALYEAGEVDLHQPRRRDCSGFDYMMIRRDRSGAAPAAREDDDPALDTILRALKRCANFGRICPTDTDLARLAGLATRDQASWRLRKLVKAGVIRTQAVVDDAEITRVVTIVRSGRQTRVPAHWAAARKSMVRDSSGPASPPVRSLTKPGRRFPVGAAPAPASERGE